MTPSEENASSQQELAERRTQWAWERTLLAKHRTFSAWIRTGLAALAVGFLGAELLAALQPRWLIRAAGAALIMMAIVIFILGFVGYADTFRNLKEQGDPSSSFWVVAFLTTVLVFISVAALALVLLN